MPAWSTGGCACVSASCDWEAEPRPLRLPGFLRVPTQMREKKVTQEPPCSTGTSRLCEGVPMGARGGPSNASGPRVGVRAHPVAGWIHRCSQGLSRKVQVSPPVRTPISESQKSPSSGRCPGYIRLQSGRCRLFTRETEPLWDWMGHLAWSPRVPG